MKSFFKKLDKRKLISSINLDAFGCQWWKTQGFWSVWPLSFWCDSASSILKAGFLPCVTCVYSILMTDAQIFFEKRMDVYGKYKYRSTGKWGFYSLDWIFHLYIPNACPAEFGELVITQLNIIDIQNVGKKKESLILIHTFNAWLPLKFLYFPFLALPFFTLKSMLCWWVLTLFTPHANCKTYSAWKKAV